MLQSAIPVLFVRDLKASSDFYRDKLGFAVDFLYGDPPFYGAVSRDSARLHLRRVGRPNFAELAAQESSLILAFIEVDNAKGLFGELQSRDVTFAQPPTRQEWGGTEFQVRDPDGNVLAFVEFAND